ncbi:Splicing factor-like protein [Trema orientale]|uniref:Splicing factor-like protein n=1 Tax=Trema orientale TaxID=63057 RepID=A0A2P5BWR2_TREOI|nr:Splicing factor-like protein [Trema orientale]
MQDIFDLCIVICLNLVKVFANVLGNPAYGKWICVWCWHHIMDMAEKDESEGRCPACRVPYDKEKIVGMAAKCESRLVAEVHMERKMKSQKAKSKSSEGRKQLSSVRVIQRNLVYIVGLPLNLADEELLQRREYFGQYGKVLKVSMSRTAAGVIQQYQNNTCSVYITYSKEDEAIRCIQNVHGFVLDGRSLRACFGTTKYCHAWLRNVPCTNPDCLYLHEVGSQEDSFTKDEIISAYTRSRVQQITGAANNVQRRSGNVLPPPLDDYCNNSSASSGKPIVKNGSNNVGNIAKGSPPNGSTGRSIALPAAASWGMRGSNCHPLAANLTCTNGLPKQKPETVSDTLAFSSAVAGTAQTSITHGDGGKRQSLVEGGQNIDAIVKPETLKPVKQHNNLDSQSSMPEKPAGLDEPPSVNLSNQFSCPPVSCPPVSRDDDRGISMPPSISNNPDRDRQSSSSGNENELFITSEGRVQNLCSEISSLCIDRNVMDEQSGKTTPSSAFSDHSLNKSPVNQGLQQYYSEHSREPSTISQKVATSVNEVSGSRDQPDWISDSQTQVMPNTSSELEEDIISFDNQRLKDPEVVSRSTYLPNSTSSFHTSNHSCSPFQQHEAYAAVNSNPDRLFVDNKFRDSSFLGASTTSLTSNGYPSNLAGSYIGSERTSEHSFLHLNEDTGKHLRRFLGDAANTDVNSVVDKGESSIISNILSLDFDTWDESLASPQNFAKLLGDDDKQSGSHRLSSSWKAQTNNQSRFSFARQEDSVHQAFDVRPSHNIIGQLSNNHPSSHNFAENRDLYFDKLGLGNGFSSSSFEESENHASNHSAFPSNKLSAVSRAQISAPPGFSVPSRAPPPGFASHERLDQTFDSLSGNRLLDTSSLLRNAYQSQVTGNMGSTADIEFMDPAILAVGKGRLQGGLNNPALEVRPNFPSQLGSFENDARLQLLMSRSLSPQQNLRFPDIGDSFSHFSDSYGIPSRLVDQSQVNNLSPFAQMSIQQSRNGLMSNGHWDGWSEVQGGNTGMAELLRNERLGYNKFYAGYEDSKFRMPSSGDLYNRTFGM